MRVSHTPAACFACRSICSSLINGFFPLLGFHSVSPPEISEQVTQGKLGTKPSGFHPAPDTAGVGKRSYLGIFFIGSSEVALGGLQVEEF